LLGKGTAKSYKIGHEFEELALSWQTQLNLYSLNIEDSTELSLKHIK